MNYEKLKDILKWREENKLKWLLICITPYINCIMKFILFLFFINNNHIFFHKSFCNQALIFQSIHYPYLLSSL